MESRDLNNDHDEARLEAWLRDGASSQPPLPDNGFSARVMAALPPAAPVPAHGRVRPRRVFVLCGLGAVAGALVTFAGPVTSHDYAAPLAALGEAVTRLTEETASGSGALVLAGIIGSLAIAYWRELRSLVDG